VREVEEVDAPGAHIADQDAPGGVHSHREGLAHARFLAPGYHVDHSPDDVAPDADVGRG
jgi:hypothetical protein